MITIYEFSYWRAEEMSWDGDWYEREVEYDNLATLFLNPPRS